MTELHNVYARRIVAARALRRHPLRRFVILQRTIDALVIGPFDFAMMRSGNSASHRAHHSGGIA